MSVLPFSAYFCIQHCQITSEKSAHCVILVQTTLNQQKTTKNSKARGEVRRDSGLYLSFESGLNCSYERGLSPFPTMHLTLLVLSPLENHFFFFFTFIACFLFLEEAPLDKKKASDFFDLSQASFHCCGFHVTDDRHCGNCF